MQLNEKTTECDAIKKKSTFMTKVLFSLISQSNV